MNKLNVIRDIVPKIFNKLNVSNISGGCKVAVPNDTKWVCIQVNDQDKYYVSNLTYNSTYDTIGDAVIEIMECLVTRELYSKGYSIKDIKFVVSKLLN